jgi:hypothetical protein
VITALGFFSPALSASSISDEDELFSDSSSEFFL